MARRTPKSPMHHVYRIDLPDRNTFGWQVRTRKNGKEKSKYFSDDLFESAAHSLVTAMKWRDKVLK